MPARYTLDLAEETARRGDLPATDALAPPLVKKDFVDVSGLRITHRPRKEEKDKKRSDEKEDGAKDEEPLTATDLLDPSQPPIAVAPVSAYCPHHPDRILAPCEQTDVSPFDNRSTCCIAVVGASAPCGRTTGLMYRCGVHYAAKEGEEREGREMVCVFALCAAHARPTGPQQAKAIAVGTFRTLRNNGAMWLLCTASETAMGLCYVPFLKTALMIVSCHPYYQCEFGACWGPYAEQQFIVAALLSIVVIVFFGGGYPIAMFAVIRHRCALVAAAFLDPGGATERPRAF